VKVERGKKRARADESDDSVMEIPPIRAVGRRQTAKDLKDEKEWRETVLEELRALREGQERLEGLIAETSAEGRRVGERVALLLAWSTREPEASEKEKSDDEEEEEEEVQTLQTAATEENGGAGAEDKGAEEGDVPME
jgi:hypothetical protein